MIEGAIDLKKLLEENRAAGKTIYMVTVVLHDKGNVGRTRCWGWYSKLEDAEEAVLQNATDMFEVGYYNMAVIEELPEGVMSIAQVCQWYKADYGNMRTQHDPTVEKCNPPEEASHYINWCIG